MQIKLSIITINYNNLDGLKKTMESVFAQTCKDFEYIVIDGASADGGAGYIQDHANQLTYWVSEKDTGIYNAMNKGVRAANGEYVLMLNSGDFLVDNHVIERIIPELDGTDIIQGNTIITRQGDEYLNRGYGRSDISFIDVQCGHFVHQAAFCKHSLFNQYGYFDESLRIHGDTKFFYLTLGFGNATFRYVDVNIAYYDMNGISAGTTENHRRLFAEEQERMDKEVFSNRLMQLCLDAPKKIALYNKLHRHKWAWYITMLLVRVLNRIENKNV